MNNNQSTNHQTNSNTVLDIDPDDQLEPLLSSPSASTFTRPTATSKSDGFHPFSACLSRFKHQHTTRPLRIPLILITITISTIILIIIFSASFSSIQEPPPHKKKTSFTFQDTVSGIYNAERKSISWLREAGDGVYSDITAHGIELHDLKSKTTKLLLSQSDIRTPNGKSINYKSFTVSSDLRYVMLKSDIIKQWRYSTFANYWIFDTHTKTIQILHPNALGAHTNVSLATWSPSGHSIAYVHQNDIYLLSSPSSAPLRLTHTGTPTLFNGLCDWVYEEEVFEGSSAIWWSPDSTKLTYLVLDEALVPNYGLTVYNPTSFSGNTEPYPTRKPMKYPKPGFPNPLPGLKVFDLRKFDSIGRVDGSTSWLKMDHPFPDRDRIVSQVAWVSDTELVVRETDRIGSREKTGYFQFVEQPYAVPGRGGSWPEGVLIGKVAIDIDFVKRDGGWAEPDRSIVSIDINSHRDPTNQQKHPTDLSPGYLDIRVDQDGYRHVAYFSPPNASEPIFLTSGQWEIDGSIQAIDLSRRLIYFIAAKPSIERHLYSVRLPTSTELTQIQKERKPKGPKQLTTGVGYYGVNFSPFGGYSLLNYDGPEVPWQKLSDIDSLFSGNVEDEKFEANKYLKHRLKSMDMPEIDYKTIKNSVGDLMNVKELRPAGMDKSGSTKYPVLIKVYGGPNSQVVDVKYAIDWHYFLISKLNYIVVLVDGRGTGMKGRSYRVPVRNQLGSFEAHDVAAAARSYGSLNYVDEARIGVWGWSYGGYLTCKTLEQHSSDFSLGLAVAPVTDWKFYDSIYTERYMSTPELNKQGYETSAVTKMNGFHNVSLALAHGSADDNVHFMNSASLIDRLINSGVGNYEFRMFTDSDHSVYTRGAYSELFKFLTRFLVKRWGLGNKKESTNVSEGLFL
ncbi:dipeptidyl aminopeptidase IV [Melampsora larici-populina 98AG31]|uniref:Dipeptidyl aminopeptidase IV n=1 Tax=Melampsora larici-populina (strain 98AG31 / pathotype 3-4-7) TaxID=747676 RepID=F4S2H3_MELLP|nr:dipeptidyl aminopeptidase IV [Melampsora larici-populina 98AG31]EGG01205.1 dipeptidyl aminopeptidase IV [Melampsora larici-populina 98AG31]